MRISNSSLKGFVVSTLAVSVFLTGCGRDKVYVNSEVGKLDKRVTPLEADTKALNASVKDNAERIDAVDRRATQGITAAQTAANAAQTTATQANTAATAAQTAATGAQRTADTANQGVQSANVRITNVENRFGNLDRFTAGPVQKVQFKVNSATLSDDAKKTLDGVAGPVASLNAGYRVEIQGFASAEGTLARNLELSEMRSEAVRRYLVSKGVELIRISIVGMGPIGELKDRASREANRRVEVRVFRAAN